MFKVGDRVKVIHIDCKDNSFNIGDIGEVLYGPTRSFFKGSPDFYLVEFGYQTDIVYENEIKHV